MDSRVLVTGATGLLGRPLVSELARRGFALTTLSSRPKEDLPPMTHKIFDSAGAQHLGFDLVADVAVGCPQLREVLASSRFDLIINLAADRGGEAPGGKGATQRRMNNSCLNTEMPYELAKLATEFSVKMIHLSTEYVWSGSENEPTGYPEVAVTNDPRFVETGPPYALQKRDAEKMLMVFPNTTILRVPVLYGPMLVAKEDGTAGKSIENFLTENSWKHDTWQRRYPTFSLDVAFILGSLSQKLCTSGLKNRVYHYGARESVSKYEFIAHFAEAAGLSPDRIMKEDASSKPADKRPPYDVRLDCSATRKELADDWREPSRLAEHMQHVWLPHFELQIAALKRSQALSDPVAASRPGAKSPEAILLAFLRKIDTKQDGYISIEKLSKLLRTFDEWDDISLDEMFAQVERDGAGRVNYEAYVKWIMGAGSPRTAGGG